MLVSSAGERENGLWVANALLLFRMSVTRDSEGREYASLQYVDVTCPIYMVDVTFGCVSLRWSTDDEVDYSVERVTGSLEPEHLSAVNWFGIENLQTVKYCVNVLRANHALEPITETIP